MGSLRGTVLAPITTATPQAGKAVETTRREVGGFFQQPWGRISSVLVRQGLWVYTE